MINWTIKEFKDLSAHELYEILALRAEVFVVEQNCVYQDLDGKDLKSLHFLGKNETGELVAYSRILPTGVSYADNPSIGRIVIAPSARRQGLGKILVQKSVEQIKELYGVSDNRIGAQCYLIAFYSELGYRIVGEEYLEDGIPHIEMIYHK